MGRGTLGEVRKRSEDPQGGPGLVGGPFARYETGRGTLEEVWDRSGALREVRDGLGDPRGGAGQVGGPSGWSGMVCRTLREVRDGLGEPWQSPGRFVGPLGTLRDVLDGSVDLRGGPGRFVRPSGWSETSRRTLGEVQARSGDPRGSP